MKLFFEGVTYPKELIKSYFGDKFHIEESNGCRITAVGYYYNNSQSVCYILPKLFIDPINAKYYLNSEIPFLELATYGISRSSLGKEELKNAQSFLILFYQSLKEYKYRIHKASISKETLLNLSSSLGSSTFSYLDLLLSIVNFYKTHRDTIVFTQKKLQKRTEKKVNWTKTITKSTPFFIDNKPVYQKVSAKHKVVNTEEDLMVLFESIVYYIKNTYGLALTLNNTYETIKGSKFKKVLDRGSRPLRKIKYKYFSDTMKSIYNMVELFLSKSHTAHSNKENEEYIIVNSYHQVFEDMIDKLLTNQTSDQGNDKISRSQLKHHKDGKIIDHIFGFKDLLSDESSIHYIADSKYYLPGNELDQNSIYKQFTYAKNTIQLNIDAYNSSEKDSMYSSSNYYRDELTEGYNITPNLFLKASLNDLVNYNNIELRIIKNRDGSFKSNNSFHFNYRLFDRDTLYINHYTINYLFVLNQYVNSSYLSLRKTQAYIYDFLRKSTIAFLSSDDFDYELKKVTFQTLSSLEVFVNSNFKTLNGKIFRTQNKPNELIIALHADDIFLKDFLNGLEDDFIIERFLYPQMEL